MINVDYVLLDEILADGLRYTQMFFNLSSSTVKVTLLLYILQCSERVSPGE